MDEVSDEKRRLLRAELEGAANEALRIEQAGRDLSQSGRQARDIFDPLAGLVNLLPPAEAERTYTDVVRWREQAGEVLKRAGEFRVLRISTDTITNTVASNVTVIYPVTPPEQQSRKRLVAAIDRLPLVERASDEMRRLGLDSEVTGQRNALDRLSDARRSLDLPATVEDGIGPLLALRECIDAAIGQLLRLRPIQEPAKGRDKIISIGRQCSNSPAAVFEHIADDIHRINDELSGAKQASYSRDHVLELFNRGLSALVALVSNVDESKLRRT